MIDVILSGVLLGLVLAMLIGPVFFLLIDTSIKRGFRIAAWLAAGVMLSDAFFIVITYFSSTALTVMKEFGREIGIGGALLLIVFGILNFIKKPHIQAAALDLPDDSRTPLVDTAKGFMMNFLNPFVLLFWMGVAGGISAREQWSRTEVIVFYSVVLTTVLGTDLLKAWLALKLKKVLKPSVLMMVNKISGVGLIIFGVRLLYLILLRKELG
ncbi:MAG: LysE family transporter [Bacteroidia bacterium]